MGAFTINGAPAALQPAQSQLVLALALNGQEGLSNGQLCYLLGPDPDHPKPSDSLRQLIVRTRRQLGRTGDGREWIEHLGAGQYALHPDAKLDWAEFEDLSEQGLRGRDRGCLRDALALIRGKPFTGCTPAQQAAILEALDAGTDPEVAPGHHFFQMLKGMTAEIYYATEIGRNELNKGGRVPATFACRHPEHA